MKYDNDYYKNRFRKEFSIIGKILYFVGVYRLYKNGACLSLLFSKWHPISWIIFVVCCFVGGASEAYKEMFVVPDVFDKGVFYPRKKIEWFSVFD